MSEAIKSQLYFYRSLQLSLKRVNLSREKNRCHSSRGLCSFSSIFFLADGYPRGLMVKAMDCGIVVSEFVLQSRYYVHFRANTLGKGMNPLILPAMG